MTIFLNAQAPDVPELAHQVIFQLSLFPSFKPYGRLRVNNEFSNTNFARRLIPVLWPISGSDSIDFKNQVSEEFFSPYTLRSHLRPIGVIWGQI